MTAHRIELPAKLSPVFVGDADFRYSHGGRGSGKSWGFAKMAAVRGAMWDAEGRSGVILCVRQFMNSLDDSSLQDIKNAIASDAWLSTVYEVGEKYIRTHSGRVRFVFAGTSVNLDSIKSKSKILLCWAEEAENIKQEAWEKIIPTIREEGSECWATWNPETERSWVHKNLRLSDDPLVKGVELNWRDNPWWTEKLERMRAKAEKDDPDNYAHVWEGEFKTVFKGAYFTRDLTKARVDGRITAVPRDPLMSIRAYWDIGGTSARSDACAIWICQFVGQKINVLNYYEAVGQPLSVHVDWLRTNGYSTALCVLPHDGVKHDMVYKVTYESSLQDAGFDVEVIPNQGAGAANARIEAARRVLPRVYFDEGATEAGIKTLQAYHEKWDDDRNIGLGPEHDWASHGCFAPETKVLTRYGMCRIDRLPETGEVMTPCGWKQYVLPRITKRAASLVEVEFENGYTVRCTPDHMFLTESGWRSADSLTSSTPIQSTLTRSLSISMAASTVFGRAIDISRVAARSFTGMFGRLLSGQSLLGVTSTTKTEIPPTTVFPTSNVLRLQSTFDSRGRKRLNETGQGISLSLPETRLLRGTEAKKEGSGTDGTPSEARDGPNGSGSQGYASNVALSSLRSSGKAVILRYIALRAARLLHIGSAESKTPTPLRIVSVKRISETADVWDITVPDGHCFSLENGAVVHNSDAFGLMCVHYEVPPEQKRKSGRRAASWMG